MAPGMPPEITLLPLFSKARATISRAKSMFFFLQAWSIGRINLGRIQKID